MTIWLLVTMLIMAYMGVSFHLSIRHLEKKFEILRDDIDHCLDKHDEYKL